MRKALFGAVIAAVVGIGAPARAATMPPDVRAELGLRQEAIQLVSSWGRSPKTRLVAGKAKPVTLHDGVASATLVVGHERVVIALAVDDASHPFRIHVMDDKGPGRAAKLARPSKRHDSPFAVAATATPDGFAVFFQEVQSDDPSAAHTYLASLDKAGKPLGDVKEVPVPWSLGAAIWNGAGFHLALFYPGDASGMRLSMVSLSADGQPEQHPDWSSAAGYIADVHLVSSSGMIRAFYRGGTGGDRLLESDVTAIRGWGGEPPKAKDHGALPAAKVIVVDKDGRPQAIKRSALR